MDIVNHNALIEEIKNVATGFWICYNFNYSNENGFEWLDLLKNWDYDDPMIIEELNRRTNTNTNTNTNDNISP